MTETKYVMNMGLAVSEEKDMERLSKYAEEGWLLEGFSFLGFYYKLTKAAPQQVTYNLDYQADADEDYFSIFESANWIHVYSHGHMHIFRAPSGTKPIYSDRSTTIEKYRSQKESFGKAALLFLILSILTFVTTSFSSPGWTLYLSLSALIISLVGLIFTGLPYWAFFNRYRKLKK